MSTCCPDTSLRTDQTVAESWRSGTRALRHTLERLRQLVTAWRAHQRFRRDLRRLPDYLLRDIGLDVEDAREESRRPFWQI